jgi:rhodanese-related sulfurtransferase
MRTRLHLLAAALLATSHAPSAESEPPKAVLPAEVREIAPEAVQRYLVDHPDTQILDVRTEEERRARGYILNSIHHDYLHGKATFEALAKLDKNRPCLIYCAIGGRAKFVALEMHKKGFTNVLLLKGGFNAWSATGNAVAK